MARAAPLATVAAVALLGAAGPACNGTSGKVFESVDAATPPGSNLRVDAFLVRSASMCAVGVRCTSTDQARCFTVAGGAGGPVLFDPSTVVFLAPDEPAVQQAAQSACFRLVLDDAGVATGEELLNSLRAQVFQASGGEINLDIRVHQVATIQGGFSHYHSSLFLDGATVEALGLPMVSRETDFTFAITGSRDPDSALAPRIDLCAGSNGVSRGIGGAAYSWIGLTDACAQRSMFLSTWMVQLYLAIRDVPGLPDLYANGYPACRAGDPDPTRWYPAPDDCTTDPDARSCGAAACPDLQAYYVHVLTTHWLRGHPFNGNHCSDGRLDYDETALDSGGVCDRLGR